METLIGELKKTGDSVGQGVGRVATGIGKGLEEGGHVLQQGLGGGPASTHHNADASERPIDTTKVASDTTKGTSQVSSDSAGQAQETAAGGSQSGGLFTTLFSGASAILAPTADIAKSGAALARDSATAGLSIGQKVAKSGLDMGANVATGTAAMTGTALGGVVAAAAETSGAVFEPIGSGLKAIEGLDKLGQGVETINGLSLGAVRQVSSLTRKSLNMSGVVRIPLDFS
jgi:hypothetical protein